MKLIKTNKNIKLKRNMVFVIYYCLVVNILVVRINNILRLINNTFLILSTYQQPYNNNHNSYI